VTIDHIEPDPGAVIRTAVTGFAVSLIVGAAVTLLATPWLRGDATTAPAPAPFGASHSESARR